MCAQSQKAQRHASIPWSSLTHAWPRMRDVLPAALSELDWAAPIARWRAAHAAWRETVEAPLTHLEVSLDAPQGPTLRVTFEDDHAALVTLDGGLASGARWIFDALCARALGAGDGDAVDEAFYRVRRGGTSVTIDLLDRRVTFEPSE